MWFSKPPFDIGDYWPNTAAGNPDGAEIGRSYYVPDWDKNNMPKLRSNRIRKLRVVRNSTGAAVLPKRLVSIKSGTYGQEVDKYTNVNASANCFPADEFLPSAGAPNLSLFFVVTEGPALVSTNGAANGTNVFAVDATVVASTANGTTNTTMAGRVAAADFTGATAVLAEQIRNQLGRALSAATTANTNSDLLIDVKPLF